MTKQRLPDLYKVNWVSPNFLIKIPTASFRFKSELDDYLQRCLCPHTGWSIECLDLDGTVYKLIKIKTTDKLLSISDVISNTIKSFTKVT